MGWWKTEHGLGGDAWADVLDSAMHTLTRSREITMAEFADLVEFCSRGHLIVSVRHPEDAGRLLSQLHDSGVETYENDGQIHCEPVPA